jgi:tetratricopeptide (TPR) repeat protein
MTALFICTWFLAHAVRASTSPSAAAYVARLSEDFHMRATFLPGFVLLLAVCAGPLAAQEAPAAEPTAGQLVAIERLKACQTLAETKPAEAWESGLAWRAERGGAPADLCIAAGLEGLERWTAAGEKYEALGINPLSGTATERAYFLFRAGTLFLQARQPADALRVLNVANQTLPGEPDILIDRARVWAMEGDWAKAEADLTTALALRGMDALALRLRAEARLKQSKLDGAQADVDAALRIEPRNIDTLVLRGDVAVARAAGDASVETVKTPG